MRLKLKPYFFARNQKTEYEEDERERGKEGRNLALLVSAAVEPETETLLVNVLDGSSSTDRLVLTVIGKSGTNLLRRRRRLCHFLPPGELDRSHRLRSPP
ncbi:hypothetical protein F2Q68_00029023 [Brassica cretica]|uniref:Uncharacterized protein n=1 Tax=Brassica cretica TaxID=69181 RepID=A0A8S9GCM4_BRACR|nr:hypothetical protein F2Q68_00029023 [Brassica cretica]